jgi:predicted acetyltransferase
MEMAGRSIGSKCEAAGMGIEIRVPRDEQLEAMCHADGRGFGFFYDDKEIPVVRQVLDLSRFRVAIDTTARTDTPDGGIVAAAGSYSFDMTVPGGATMPMGGVTWVSVASTHRRRGILRELMTAIHDDIDERGEPVAALTASDSGIYERFGYGIATTFRMRSIDTRAARLDPRFVPDSGPNGDADGTVQVRFVAVDDPAIVRLWERHRRTRAGELSRDERWHTLINHALSEDDGGFGKGFAILHADGYARYRIKQNWNMGFPEHELAITDLVALTPDAHVALWHTLLSTDLVRTITTRSIAEDDPLPYLLTDPRSARTTNVNDGVWINLRDPVVAYGARTWGTEDRFVVELTDGPFAGKRLAFDASPTEGDARWVRSKPDLTCTHAALGAMFLGGVRPSALAAGRRLTARSADILRRADAAFFVAPMPHCQTFF